MKQADISVGVIKIIEEALMLKSGSINLESRFGVDFTCNSIDLIMVLSELEREFKVKIIGKQNHNSFIVSARELNKMTVGDFIAAIANLRDNAKQ